MGESSESHEAGTVDYKTLFLGACMLISVLGNGFAIYVVSAINDTNRLQWQRLKELDEAITDLKNVDKTNASDRGYLRRDTDDQEIRIRALEHRGERR